MIGLRLAERYELVEELGSGGLGREFLADDPLLDRQVLVKWFGPATPAADGSSPRLDLEALLHEARNIAGLSHPAIAQVYDVGRFDAGVFLVMPRLRGRSVAAWHRQRGLDLGEILTVGVEIATALGHAAAHGVLHRDVRAEHLWVSRDHGQLRCWLTSFCPATGLVQRLRAGARPAAWSTPEGLQGAPPEHRSDLFCLARVLYELLLGESPWGPVPWAGSRSLGGDDLVQADGEDDTGLSSGAQVAKYLERVWRGPPTGLDVLGLGIGFDALWQRLLAPRPEDRPENGLQVAESLRQLLAQASPTDRRRLPLSSPDRPGFQPPRLVGRHDALQRFDHHLSVLPAEGSRWLLLEGEAGLGKSRLLEELERMALARGYRVLTSPSMQGEGTLPLARFQGLLAAVFERQGEGRWPRELRPWATELGRLFPGLLDLTSADAATPASTEATTPDDLEPLGSDAARRFEPPELLAQVLLTLAEEHPLVLLFENLHGAEASVEVLEVLLRRLAPKPFLFAGSYRGSEVDRHHPLARIRAAERDDPRVEVLRLEALDAEEHALLVAGLMNLPSVPPTLATDLYEASDGNPFVTRELIRSLVESGDLPRPGSTTWSEGFEWRVAQGNFPRSVQQVVERRLVRVEPEHRDILAAASVIGRSFERRMLVGLCGHAEDAAEDAVDDLVRAGFLEEDRARGATLRFAGSVLRDVLYQGLPERRRRSLHRRCAEWLEARWAGRLERIYPELVHHFWSAGRGVETLAYTLMLARRSADGWQANRVVRSARVGLAALARGELGDEVHDVGEVEGELRRLLATALLRQGLALTAVRQAGASAEAFDRAGEHAAAARSAALAAEVAASARKLGEAERWIRRGLGLLGELPSPSIGALHTRLLALQGWCRRLRGDAPLALEPPPAVETTVSPETLSTKAPAVITTRPELRVARADPLPSLDPLTAAGTDGEVTSLVFEALTRLGRDGRLEPGLARSMTVDTTGRTWRIVLRDTAELHDGRRLEARHVAASLTRLVHSQDPAVSRPMAAVVGASSAAGTPAGSGLPGLRVVDAHTLELQLEHREPRLPLLFSVPASAIAVEAEGSEGLPNANPGLAWVGTGPYRPRRFGSDRIELEAVGASSGFHHLTIRGGMPSGAMAEGLRAGDFDLASDLAPEEVAGLGRSGAPALVHYEVPSLATGLLWLNRRSPKLDTLEARRALAQALALDSWLVPALAASGMRAAGLLPPGLGEPVSHAPVQPPIARQGLPWYSLSLAVDTTVRRHAGRVLRGITQALNDRGLDLSLDGGSTVEVLRRLRPGGASKNDTALDFVVVCWDGTYPDRGAFFDLLTLGRDDLEEASWRPWIGRDRESEDAEERTRLARQLRRRFEDELEILPLFHPQRHHFVHPTVGACFPAPVSPQIRYETLVPITP